MLKLLQVAGSHSFIAVIALLTFGALPSISQSPDQYSSNPLKAFTPPDNPDGDLDSPGGGTRGGGCYSLGSEGSIPLMAVSPLDARLAQTQEARPKFRALVSPTDADYGIFTLQDAEGSVHYRGEMIALPEKGGFVTITLPPEVELAPEQSYRWFFEVLCAGHIDPNNPIAEGQIHRVAETSTSVMRSSLVDMGLNLDTNDVTTILAHVEFYRQSNLWYEAINTLAAARQAHPEDDRLKQSWEDLLELAGITTESDAVP